MFYCKNGKVVPKSEYTDEMKEKVKIADNEAKIDEAISFVETEIFYLEERLKKCQKVLIALRLSTNE